MIGKSRVAYTPLSAIINPAELYYPPKDPKIPPPPLPLHILHNPPQSLLIRLPQPIHLRPQPIPDNPRRPGTLTFNRDGWEGVGEERGGGERAAVGLGVGEVVDAGDAEGGDWAWEDQ